MAVVLAGDIGGTNTRLGYFEVDGSRLEALAIHDFASAASSGLSQILIELRAKDPRPIVSAAFGVAGPVKEGRSKTPNLAWTVDSAVLASVLGLGQVALINDLAANAYGIAYLGPPDLELLHPGHPEALGHIAVISAGTGLGQAGLFWDGIRHRPFASEGGHCDLAPHDALELDLWRHLSLDGHVSYERVVSGPGLVTLYEFLRGRRPGAESPEVARAMREGNPAAVISQHGLSRADPLCSETLDRFVRLYGSAAGNVALQFFATGGVYVGGGIAPKIRERLREGGFVEAFLDKGRMRTLLEAIPVKLIVNDRTALWGAAHVAAFGL